MAARLLNLMGLSLGPDDDLLLPAPDNPTGFWESQSLMTANDEILRALGGDWRAPPQLEVGWHRRSELDGLRQSGVETLGRLFPATEWVWKDPRNCLTLPFWLTLTDDETAVVLVYRSPLEVATSLRARNGFPVAFGLALWERYTRSAFAAARGLPVHVVGYDLLIADPGGWCAGVSEFLRHCRIEPSPVRPEALRSFVQPNLRHSAFSEEDLPPGHRALYASLKTCEGSHDRFTPPTLPPEAPYVQSLFDQHRSYCQLEQQFRQGKQEAEREVAARQRAETKLALIEASRAWKATAPLRRLAAAFDRTRQTQRGLIGGNEERLTNAPELPKGRACQGPDHRDTAGR